MDSIAPTPSVISVTAFNAQGTIFRAIASPSDTVESLIVSLCGPYRPGVKNTLSLGGIELINSNTLEASGIRHGSRLQVQELTTKC
mmetsp:Transcript_2470/g.5716  ORF Transcript_2470/g.5716 Transcript_2470/m.5716 type:complete len:86 (-) Transcript_2470:200-457(-)